MSSLPLPIQLVMHGRMLTDVYIEARLMRDWWTGCGRLGIRGLLSEISVSWNREQTDSLAQVITEAGPRYHFYMQRTRFGRVLLRSGSERPTGRRPSA